MERFRALMRTSRTLLVLLLGLNALLALMLVPHRAVAATRRNVVVVETDDETMADLASMPHVRALIADHGVSFTNSFVSLSQCCPSRATFLTGQYAHNHGVLTTQPPFGGFPAFHDRQSLPVWLQKAGYRTALVGKYFNKYGKSDPTYVPPGWSDWHGLEGGSVYHYQGFQINDNGHVRSYPGQYQSDVLESLDQTFVKRSVRARKPFFLWATFVAPHIGTPKGDPFSPPKIHEAVPLSIFANPFLGIDMPRTPAFNEADVRDKPRDIRRRPLITPNQISVLQNVWARRQEALQSVDEDVVRLFRTLRATHTLRNTLVIFTSDNGYLIGEHRVLDGKVLPYEPSIRVPLLMRGPGIPHGAARNQLVFNGDLAPTIVAATGAHAAWPTDGESLLPIARRDTHSDRAILLEGPPHGNKQSVLEFTGIRTKHYAYVHYHDGEAELYDLRRDPYELQNLAGRPADERVQRHLAHRLDRLRWCSGPECRTA
jgi:arylsulfatase A-like enzyme